MPQKQWLIHFANYYPNFMKMKAVQQMLTTSATWPNRYDCGYLFGPIQHLVKSMNGHLTHSRTQIHDQLIFSVQINQALQHHSTFVTDNEDENTLKFLSYCQNSLPQKNKLQIVPHVHTVGTLHYNNLIDEEHRAISLLSLGSVGSKVKTFSRMF